MAIDLNQEQDDQQPMNYGPVPSGSAVMLTITIQKALYASPDNEYVSRATTGLLTLWCKFEVVRGEYEGVSWYENLALPVGQQKIALNKGQTTNCNISGAKIKAIVNAARGIDPKDLSPRATRARELQDWLDLNGMEFPARLGIDNKPYTSKNGQERWNNCLGIVITPDREEYAMLKQGKEIITDGAVTGQGKGAKARRGGNSRSQDDYDDDLGPAFPSEYADTDDPF